MPKEILRVAIPVRVLHPNTHYTPWGVEAPEGIPEHPYGDALPFLRRLIANSATRAYLMSSHSPEIVSDWLMENGLYADELSEITITQQFVDADVYVMDAVALFDGQYPTFGALWNVTPYSSLR